MVAYLEAIDEGEEIPPVVVVREVIASIVCQVKGLAHVLKVKPFSVERCGAALWYLYAMQSCGDTLLW